MLQPYNSDELAAAVAERFGPIASEFGLRALAFSGGQREDHQRYQGDDVQLDVYCEFGSDPFVTVGTRTGHRFGLHQLVGRMAPERESELRSDPEGESIAAMLTRLAALTRELAAGLLAGETAEVDELRREQVEQVRRDNQRCWGTATGETPRFDHRPTLEELYSDASNQGLVEARSYQACHDHDYTIAQIAAFLHCGEDDVQRHLDRWDGLLH